MTASITGSLEGLTPLIIAVLAFAAILLFRSEIKSILRRLTKLEANRKGTRVSADLGEDPKEPTDPSSSVAGREEPEAARESDEIAPIRAGDTGDAEAVRARMIHAYMDGDKKEGDELFEKLGPLEEDAGERRRDRARQLATQVVGGVDSNGLLGLKRMTEDPEVAGFAYRMIGICQNASERPAEAEEAFAEAVALAADDDERATAAALRAEALTTLGRDGEGIAQLTEMVAGEADSSAMQTLWEALAEAYERIGDSELKALALHEVARLVGNNASKWFDAAYAYSKADEDHFTILTIHCYSIALSLKPDHQFAKNNMGAQLSGSQMPILGVDFYKEAADLGNTLAQGNMAQKYLNAGFAGDAEELLEDARKRPTPDTKIAEVTARIATKRKNEEERFAEIRDLGSRAGNFMLDYAEARNSPTPGLSGDWKMSGASAELDLVGKELTVKWSQGSFRKARRFTGTIAGAGVSGQFSKEGFSLSSENVSWEADGLGYGILEPEQARIRFIKLTSDQADYPEMSASSSSPPLDQPAP
jgi:tetratricopeptide (TPR) repeat protein